jgi:hypothetical protein
MVFMETPPEVEQYFASGRRSVKKVEAQRDFKLRILFDNGEVRLFDMGDTLRGKAFVPIRKWNRFKDVYLDKSGSIAWDADPAIDSSVVWNNHLDLCPDSCYIYGEKVS